MPSDLPTPLIYLITPGETTEETEASSAEFARLVDLVSRAADARIPLVQLREKRLKPRILYELAARAAEVSRGSATRILVNDRADIARAAVCDGVQLTTRSLDASIVRRAFGEDFIIGVSAHSLEEARAARDGGADFVLLGPVFDTPSKRAYGPPLGLEPLRAAAASLQPFPIIAIGGISVENARTCLEAGASGVAAIRLFTESSDLRQTLRSLGL